MDEDETMPVIAKNDPTLYRIESFVRLGYDRELAVALAGSKDKYGVFIYHGDAKALIEAIEKAGKSEEESRHIAFGILSDA